MNLLAKTISNVSESIATDRQLALKLAGVERSFGRIQALRDVSLQVDAGERLALLGPNGAGKTTLIRVICGRLRIEKGRIEIFGESIDRPNVLDQLGVVPQELAIYGDLSLSENLNAFGRMHGLSGRRLRERMAWAIEWIGLQDRRYQMTKTFSGGMKRRVNIACGVLHSPKILLLDEPTVGVDPQSRQRIFEMLDELNQAGTTTILTTHHLDEAQSQCDRIVIVDHGQVIADGTLDDLIEQTTGTQRIVYLRIDGAMTTSIPNLEWDETQGCFAAPMNEPVIELPHLLQRIRNCGGNVVDLEMHQPNLHDVFLHLTGRELRE
ncbi:MAG: ABC transporter ATP-binding protein [Pirellulaceae bacterium]|nr:ABC transporter ATP-binding protein [Pirellulaceae bacterium]